MNKFLLLLSLSVTYGRTSFCQQQPYRYTAEVTYSLIFQPDSTDKKSVESEYETLFVGEGQSIFCASKYLLMDSAIASEAAKGNKLGPSMGFFQANGTHNYLVIFKSDSGIVTYDQVARFIPSIYRYTESKTQLKWKILPDTLSIGGIPCQRAETNFGDRRWIAWFAPSIPINDGPYKFCGLPGLILQINDEKQYWNFTLAKLAKADTSLKINFLNHLPEPIKDKNEFFSKKKYSRDNRFELSKLRGMKFSNEEYYIKYYRQLAEKDNNWIELYKGN